jgi:hypothetical protein
MDKDSFLVVTILLLYCGLAGVLLAVRTKYNSYPLGMNQ